MAGYFSFIDGPVAALWENFKAIFPQLFVFAVAVFFILVVYKILGKMVKHALVRTVKGRPVAVSADIKILMQVWRYIYFFIAAIVLILTFSGSLAAAGIGIGLLSAALGWALQRPITGIAAWLMILVKKPFKVGDRVIIENMVGDVSDITMFYIALDEVGGTIGGEDTSGRTILIPTSLLFEKLVINYTLTDAFVLDEASAEFTYESDLAEAEKIMLNAAEKFSGEFAEKTGKAPYTRVSLSSSGVIVSVRYMVSAKVRYGVRSDITREAYKQVMKEKKVAFAYPHTELVFGEKPSFLKKDPANQRFARHRKAAAFQ